jgi:uncharacterized protein (TIRG00374 family)
MTLVALAAGLVVVANRSDLPAAWRALRGAGPGWLVALLLLVVLYLLDLGLRHMVAQRAVGLTPRWGSMLPAAWATHFVNAISKSGGFAGIAVLTAEGRRSDKPRGSVLAAALLVAVLDQLAFAMVLPFAILVLFLDGRFSAGDGVATAVFAVYVCVTVVAVVAATRGRGSVHALYALPGRFSTWVQRVVLRRTVQYEPDVERADELFDAITLLKGRLRSAVPAALAAVAVDVLAILQLWVALRAVGVHAGPAEPFVAYSVSTLFALVGIVPGGIGIVELSVGAVLHSFGTPVALAAAAVVLFRVAEFWIPFAIGAIVSHQYVLRPTVEPT